MEIRMITTRNTNSAPYDVYPYMVANGIEESSRNGPVLTVPHPVTICYTHPQENVNFCRVRDANPFFHFMEMLWMLEARGDVELIAHYLPRMAEFSDNGINFNAHYGYNIRHHFGIDQLDLAARRLVADPLTRRAVVQIWNPEDLRRESRDLACNLELVFRQVDGRLNMTVYNRSNDAIWGGVTGANITNLFIFQAWISAATGIPVGKQYVVSNNLHLYLDNPKAEPLLDKYVRTPSFDEPHYPSEPWKFIQYGETPRDVDRDIGRFLNHLRNEKYDPTRYNPDTTLVKGAIQIALAHSLYRDGDISTAIAVAQEVIFEDWAIACSNWLIKRLPK